MSTEELSNQYTNSLNQKKLVGTTYVNGVAGTTDLSFDSLTGVNSPLAADYCLTDSNNHAWVTADMKANFDAAKAGNGLQDFLAKYGKDATGNTTVIKGVTTYPSGFPDATSFNNEQTRLTGIRDVAKKALYNDDGSLKIAKTTIQSDSEAVATKGKAYTAWQTQVGVANGLKPKTTVFCGLDNSNNKVGYLNDQMASLQQYKYTGGDLCRNEGMTLTTSQQTSYYKGITDGVTNMLTALTPQVAVLQSKIDSVKGTNLGGPTVGEANYQQYHVWTDELDSVNRMITDCKNVQTCMTKFNDTSQDADAREQAFAVANDILFGQATGDTVKKNDDSNGTVYGVENCDQTMAYKQSLGYTGTDGYINGSEGYVTNLTYSVGLAVRTYNAAPPPTQADTDKYNAALSEADRLKGIWSSLPSTGGENPNPAYTTADTALTVAQTNLDTFVASKTSTPDTTTGTAGSTTAYYTNMYNKIDKDGSQTIDKNNQSSVGWLDSQLKNGGSFLQKFQDGDWKSIDVASAGELSEQRDDTNTDIVKAKYDSEMQAIQTKDKMLDLNLKQLDTEHSALQTEVESVQKVITKNIESSFKSFG